TLSNWNPCEVNVPKPGEKQAESGQSGKDDLERPKLGGLNEVELTARRLTGTPNGGKKPVFAAGGLGFRREPGLLRRASVDGCTSAQREDAVRANRTRGSNSVPRV